LLTVDSSGIIKVVHREHKTLLGLHFKSFGLFSSLLGLYQGNPGSANPEGLTAGHPLGLFRRKAEPCASGRVEIILYFNENLITSLS